MPNGKMTTRDYLIQLCERVDNLKDDFRMITTDIREIRREMDKLKKDVYKIAGTISLIITLVLLLLRELLK